MKALGIRKRKLLRRVLGLFAIVLCVVFASVGCICTFREKRTPTADIMIIKIRVDWAVTIIIAAVIRHICMRMAYVRMETEARRSSRLTRRRRRR